MGMWDEWCLNKDNGVLNSAHRVNGVVKSAHVICDANSTMARVQSLNGRLERRSDDRGGPGPRAREAGFESCWQRFALPLERCRFTDFTSVFWTVKLVGPFYLVSVLG